MKRNRLGFISMFLMFSAASWAQVDSVALSYQKGISEADLSGHLRIIASDEFEGRETGLEGQKKCQSYLVEFYESMGLKMEQDLRIQDFSLDLSEPRGVTVSKQGRTYEFLEDYYYWPAGRDGDHGGELVFSGYGIEANEYDDVDGSSVKDRVVLLWSGEPKNKSGDYLIGGKEPSDWSTDMDKKRSLIHGYGAKAMIMVWPDHAVRKKRVAPYVTSKGMKLSTDPPSEEMPVLHISELMAEDLLGKKFYKKAKKMLRKGEVKEIIPGSVEITFRRRGEQLTSSNVMAYIEGTDKKDELLVITAHYDHIGKRGEEISNGADDDGSGTVCAMEIAQAFIEAKKDGHPPRRSILVLHVSGEEKGLLGSRYYTENPLWPLESTVANLNIDMVGRIDDKHAEMGQEDYVYLIGAGRIDPRLQGICEMVRTEHTALEFDYTYDAEDDPNRYYYRSDHYNFAEKGIPAAFFFSGVHEDYHMPTDTEEKIMYPKMTRIARLIFLSAWEIANRDEALRFDQ